MFFSVYLGPARHQSAWQAVLQAHATWLGLSLSVNNRCLTDGRQAAFGSLQHAPGIAVVLREDGDALHLDTSWGQAPHNAIDVRLSRQSEELVVDMPLTTPESCYYAHDARGCVVGNDVRLLLRWAGLQLDERAVLALWQYGAIPAPLTLSTTVQRLPLGHSLRVPPASAAPQLTASLWPPPAHEAPLAEIEPVATLQATLDAFLEQVPQNTALYFSGGVDSGLLAARLAALERRDVHLLHYTFDPDDPDSQLAARMAAHLGMPYQQVVYDPAQLPAVLERLGKDYALPFGDISVIPTNLLVHASLDRQIPAALDGTASDRRWRWRQKMCCCCAARRSSACWRGRRARPGAPMASRC